MAKERQELIARKFAEARQHRMRSALLRVLPDPLRKELESAPLLLEPHNQRIRCLAGFSERGFVDEVPARPAGFACREFSWPEQVFAALNEYSLRHDAEPAHLQPFGINADENDLRLLEGPAFAVPFGWARRNMKPLFDATNFGLALAADSFEAGIVISLVCGYLAVDPNPDERIYMLATWG